jgi:hypothetical protein
MSDNEPEQPIPEKKQVSKEFVISVKKYLEIDDKLKEMRDQLKKFTTEKKQKEEFILEYLQSLDEKVVDVPDGKLRRNISKTQAPLKKELIQKALTEIFGDASKATATTEHIIKSRPTIERVTLKRTKNRIKTQ